MKIKYQDATPVPQGLSSPTVNDLLARLGRLKRDFDPGSSGRIETLLDRLGANLSDAESLISLHESLLFLAAYPHNRRLLRKAHKMLDSFGERVSTLRVAGKSLSPFEYEEASGVAETSLLAIFSYDVLQWLFPLFPGRLQIDEKEYENPGRLAFVARRLLPLLEEDSLVEANVPFFAWLHAASGLTNNSPGKNTRAAKPLGRVISLPLSGSSTLGWLLARLAQLPLPSREIAGLYDSLELPIRWQIDSSKSTRSRMRFSNARPFIQTGPLLRRADISLDAELAKGNLPLQVLAPARGKQMVAAARLASALRCRELFGFTYGDPSEVIRAPIGRGVELYLWGVPPDRRLPLRAYGAVLMIKNGTPIGYAEHMAIFERMEIGFNIYYTFRDGESAWLYAQLLRLFRQVYGVTSFLVDPYQIGAHNEEAIASGSFWFYRKLGFRPMNDMPARQLESEENKMKADPGYRTPAGPLRRLAEGYIIYESPGSAAGRWDHFQVRNIGLAVQKKMARDFGGDADKIRQASRSMVAASLGIKPPIRDQTSQRIFDDFAVVLALIPGLAKWTRRSKKQVIAIIRARTAVNEINYVRLLQQHAQLREALLKLGS